MCVAHHQQQGCPVTLYLSKLVAAIAGCWEVVHSSYSEQWDTAVFALWAQLNPTADNLSSTALHSLKRQHELQLLYKH